MRRSPQAGLGVAGRDRDLRAVLEFVTLLVLVLEPIGLADEFGVALRLDCLVQCVDLPAREADIIYTGAITEGVAPISTFEVD
jgi:hypothetical protein